MDVSLLRFVLICLMVLVGLAAIFVAVLPIVMLSSMASAVASSVAAESGDAGEHVKG